MHIVCSTDNNYVMPTGVMICSVLENNKEEQVVFHVLGSDLAEDSKESLSRIAKAYGKEIHFYTVNDDDFKDFPINQKGQNNHIRSLATYYRLLMGIILPPTVKKVIYLDGDVIVRHSLLELWNTKMENLPVAGVPDVAFCKVSHYNRLRYPMSLGYFNAGVLLINLDYWREHEVISEFYEIARKFHDRLTCHDQDILNYAFKENKILLNMKYNMEHWFFYKKKFYETSWNLEDEIKSALHDPVIVHYTGYDKPWYKECNHPYRNEFIKYLSMTEWKNKPMKRLHSHLWYFLHNARVSLGYAYNQTFAKRYTEF